MGRCADDTKYIESPSCIIVTSTRGDLKMTINDSDEIYGIYAVKLA